MTDAALFLAHAIALEAEAAERYDELADILEAHNNRAVAELFRRMAGFSRLHSQQVRDRADGIELPKLKTWDYEWNDVEPPESAALEDTHYLMTPYHCIRLALHNERRGQQYYAAIAIETEDPAVKRLAAEMAEEEAEHVAILEQWAARIPEPRANWDHDADPPVTAD